MDFEIPRRHPGDARRSSTRSSSARSSRSSSPTTTSGSSTTGGSTRAPTSRTAVCRARTGRTLLREMRRRADAAGWLRHALPAEYGGHDASNLEMAIIREHLATKGLGLHNDLQNESSIVGNFPTVLMMRDFGTDEQRAEWMPGFLDGTPPARVRAHRAEPRLRRDVPRDHRRAATATSGCINGMKRFNSGLHHATHDIVFAAHVGRTRLADRHHRVPRADRRRGLQRRLLLVDVQHADRPRGGDAARRARRRRRRVRRGRPRARARAALRAREPHPPGRVVARRRRSSASTKRSPTRTAAPRGASRWRATRRSSSRSSSCTPKPRCCAS